MRAWGGLRVPGAMQFLINTVKSENSITTERTFMSTPAGHATHTDVKPDQHPVDVVESVVHNMPLILPLAGAVLMFLLAFIAVYMA